MPETTGHSHQEITLEKLLRMKREENPLPEFWERFDRQLHHRQMQVLLPKPWYNRAAAVFRGRLSPLAPLAAVAVLVFGFSLYVDQSTVATPPEIVRAGAGAAATESVSHARFVADEIAMEPPPAFEVVGDPTQVRAQFATNILSVKHEQEKQSWTTVSTPEIFRSDQRGAQYSIKSIPTASVMPMSLGTSNSIHF